MIEQPRPKFNEAENVISNNHSRIFGKTLIRYKCFLATHPPTSSRPTSPRRRRRHCRPLPKLSLQPLFFPKFRFRCHLIAFWCGLRMECLVRRWGFLGLLMHKCWGCVLLLGCFVRLGLIGLWLVVESAGLAASFEATCMFRKFGFFWRFNCITGFIGASCGVLCIRRFGSMFVNMLMRLLFFT